MEMSEANIGGTVIISTEEVVDRADLQRICSLLPGYAQRAMAEKYQLQVSEDNRVDEKIETVLKNSEALDSEQKSIVLAES